MSDQHKTKFQARVFTIVRHFFYISDMNLIKLLTHLQLKLFVIPILFSILQHLPVKGNVSFKVVKFTHEKIHSINAVSCISSAMSRTVILKQKLLMYGGKKMVLTKQNCYLECSHVVTQSYYLPENVFLIEISN